jgi:hypothetical protein
LKGYDFLEIELEVVVKRKYVPHIHHKGEKTEEEEEEEENRIQQKEKKMGGGADQFLA